MQDQQAGSPPRKERVACRSPPRKKNPAETELIDIPELNDASDKPVQEPLDDKEKPRDFEPECVKTNGRKRKKRTDQKLGVGARPTMSEKGPSGKAVGSDDDADHNPEPKQLDDEDGSDSELEGQKRRKKRKKKMVLDLSSDEGAPETSTRREPRNQVKFTKLKVHVINVLFYNIGVVINALFDTIRVGT